MLSSLINSSVLFLVIVTSQFSVVKAGLNLLHLGCYSSKFAESDPYYKIRTPLTWKQGLEACNHRLTTHMAVYPDQSSPGDNFFFCGNDLLRHSVAVDESRCRRCVNRRSRYCGGTGVVSLYRLRESTPFSVLIAYSKTGLIQVTEENGVPSLSTLFSYSGKMWDMDYYYEEDEIWFNHLNNTYRSPYSVITSKYIAPRAVPSCGKVNRSPYFNWVRNTVYYGCDTEREIIELNLEGHVINTYKPNIETDMRDIAVDPYKSLAFFTTWGSHLFSYSLETSTLKEYKQLETLSLKARIMCMDHHEQNLYVIGEKTKTDKVLVRVNYNDTEIETIYEGPELFDVWRMDYFNGTIVWTSYDNVTEKNVAYKCTLTPKCQKNDLTPVYLSKKSESLSDIKVYHPMKQTPSSKHLCEQLQCSHNCSRVSLLKVECGCPPTLSLRADNRTCNAECPPLRFPSLDMRCVYKNEETSCERDVKPGTIATPKCKQNYKLSINYQTKITCLQGGEWDSKPIPCTPECGGFIEDNKISFGSEVERGEVPWQAGLYMRKKPDGTVSKRWQLLCGGTLISSHLVLTAAHCVKYGKEILKPADIIVGLGKKYRTFYIVEENSNIIGVREVLVAPYYEGIETAYNQDLALLDLNRPTKFSEYIVPACVDWQDIYRMSNGDKLYAAGWGKTEDGVASEVLLSTELSYLETSECFKRFKFTLQQFITPDKFCGETINGSQVQQGDSGGGITAIQDGRHYVIGVVSTKVLQDRKISMFTNISTLEHYTWLDEQRRQLELIPRSI